MPTTETAPNSVESQPHLDPSSLYKKSHWNTRGHTPVNELQIRFVAEHLVESPLVD